MCVCRSSDDDRKLTAIEKELLDLLRRKVLIDKKLHAGKVRMIAKPVSSMDVLEL